jgi:elongation factor P
VQFGREGFEMRLQPRTYLQRRRLHLDKAFRGEKRPHGGEDAAAREEVFASRRETVGPPPLCPLAWHRTSPFTAKLIGNRPNAHPYPRPNEMKINAIDIKPGNVLEHQNKLWVVLKRDLVQPGKGGSFAQVEMRDLRGGSKLSERFRTQETVERVRLDEKDMQFLYMEGDMATFMDNESYEQVTVPREVIGDPADFLSDGMMCQVTLYEGIALSVELPQSVTLEVVEADPVVRGQTASSSYKPGKLENGRRVMIPPHIGAGTRIVINTADGSYMERAKD